MKGKEKTYLEALRQLRADIMKQQSQKEMSERIKSSSNRKILRRQMELLAEYSRTSGVDHIPECSEAMAKIYQELVKTECRSIFFSVVLVGASFGLLHSIGVELVKLCQR